MSCLAWSMDCGLCLLKHSAFNIPKKFSAIAIAANLISALTSFQQLEEKTVADRFPSLAV